MRIEHFCAECGKQLSEDERPCSDCGCNRRNSYGYQEETFHIDDTLARQKLKRPGVPDYVYEKKINKRLSGKTKRPAIDTQTYVRTDPEKSIKKHTVEEWDGEKWITCHDETLEYKAKHRKKINND